MPETVRRSASAAAVDTDRAALRRDADRAEAPPSSTPPDRVPMMTSAPIGHLTWTEFEARTARISTAPSAVVDGGATAIDDHIGARLGGQPDTPGRGADP